MRYLHRVAASGVGGPGGRAGSMTPPRRVGVPPVSRGGQAVADRLDRHFATLVDAPAAIADDNATEALEMMTAVLLLAVVVSLIVYWQSLVQWLMNWRSRWKIPVK